MGDVCVARFGIVSSDTCRQHCVPLACASFSVDVGRVFELFESAE